MNEPSLQPTYCLGVVHGQRDTQDAFVYSSLHRQKSMGRHTGKAFPTVKVHFKLAALCGFAAFDRRYQLRTLSLIKQCLSCSRVF